MLGWGKSRSALAGLAALTALSACDEQSLAPSVSLTPPDTRPIIQASAPVAPVKPAVSEKSQALSAYYARVQQDLLVRGLLRTDGGGPDTLFTDTMLIRNFEKIALAEEYQRGGGLTPGSGELGAVKKWVKPVRLSAEFGPTVSPANQAKDRESLKRYAARLARVTGHPISMSDANPNFHVLFMGLDQKEQVKNRIKALVPNVNPTALRLFDTLPRSIHCLVIAFSDTPGGYDYGRAIAVVRAEHPDLLRQTCIHEEVAQGLGLSNDDPRARPSIFNDDDEFAFLTTHDELLLKILYNPRLRPGMTPEQSRPIIRSLAAQLMGGTT